jgi:hypothetical protein
MKNKAALIVPILFILVGIYALLTAFGSSGEQVALIGNHNVPRGLAFMFGGIGIGGGVLILSTMVSKNKSAASGESNVNHG